MPTPAAASSVKLVQFDHITIYAVNTDAKTMAVITMDAGTELQRLYPNIWGAGNANLQFIPGTTASAYAAQYGLTLVSDLTNAADVDAFAVTGVAAGVTGVKDKGKSLLMKYWWILLILAALAAAGYVFLVKK